jgi:lysozyme family protein
VKDNFTAALAAVLAYEGGFSDDPLDPGGMTNKGVTRTVWSEWLGRPASVKEMTQLTDKAVAPMYKRKYWDAVNGDELPDGLDLCVFDFAVNSGVGRAAKLLQSCLGVITVDGHIGPKTLAAAATCDVKKVIELYGLARLTFLKKLPHWSVYKNGWSNRVAGITFQALSSA